MKKLVAVLLAMVIVVFAFSGCEIQKPVDVKPGNSSEANTEPFKFGVFLRFSDEAGTKMKAVIEHTIKSINDKGGISNRKVEAVYYDTEGDSTKAVDAFTRLVSEDKVHLVIGPTTSSCALAIIDLCKEYNIPCITPQATNTKITAEYGNEWFFRNSVADVYHSYTLCDYIVNDMKAKNIAIMHETGTLGLGQYENFVSRLENEYNMKPVAVEEWNEGDVDFKTQLLAVKTANPDVIVFCGHEAELSIIVSQRLDVGISKDIPVCGFSSMSSADFYGVAGEAAVGSIFSTTFSPTDDREEIQSFVKEYESVVNGSLDHNAAQAYDTIKLLADVLEPVQITNTVQSVAEDRIIIRDALAKVNNWVGITGVTTFGSEGGPESRDGKKESSIYQLESDFTWTCLKAAK